jgi:hypothetical protein
MRKSVFTLCILGALLFDLSLALQAEDLPENPYDESQGVACEHNPVLAMQVVQDSVERTQPTRKSAFPLLLGYPTRSDEFRAGKRDRPEQPNFGTATIRAVPLRC